MSVRRAVFWLHLAVGLVMGVFILSMSVTGVLLTYERQMIRWAENAAVSQPEGEAPLSYQALADAAIAAGAGPGHVMTVPDGRTGAVNVSAGRRDSFLMDPYTGDVMPDAGSGTRAAFGRIMRIHRWLAFTGGRNAAGAAVNGTANLGFALLVVTGLFLWWPKIWRWAFVRGQLLFRRRYASVKARHYNWHHVMGFWFAIPLLVITLSGAVFSYDWANRLVYAAFGEAPGGRGGPPAQASDTVLPPLAGNAFPLDVLVGQVTEETGRGRRIAITLPDADAARVRIAVDFGNGAQPDRIETRLAARDGSGIAAPDEPAPSAASQARRFIRFVHTGEVYGLIGQTLAGLASLFAIVLVYTGACLGLSRLTRMIRQRGRTPA